MGLIVFHGIFSDIFTFGLNVGMSKDSLWNIVSLTNIVMDLSYNVMNL